MNWGGFSSSFRLIAKLWARSRIDPVLVGNGVYHPVVAASSAVRRFVAHVLPILLHLLDHGGMIVQSGSKPPFQINGPGL